MVYQTGIHKSPVQIRLRPWSAGDLPLLEQLLGDPAMTAHLGGPETPEMIRERHARYLQSNPGRDEQLVVFLEPEGPAVGWVGYWEREWQGEKILETGWSVLPRFQGQGIAGQAARLLVERLRSEGVHRGLHAFPAADNAPSNAVCRRAGFHYQGEVDFEYPRGHWMRCADWCLDLQLEEEG